MARTRFRVTGTVQGVGFRPFVFHHARELGLSGFVRNDEAGVLIEVEGAAESIDALARLLVDEPPSGARVDSVRSEALRALGGRETFRIDESTVGGSPSVAVAIDAATCDECLAEVDDPSNRRFRYPFTNCAHCGPRYTIVQSVPYDRASTTMAAFVMCAACQDEYGDPHDRRFHAQPNACPVCGPRLSFRSPDGKVLETGEAALDAAIHSLRAGQILAVKGLGGFHLVVDASDEDAVAELRRRKARDEKPFAVMAVDRDAAEALGVVGEGAGAALSSRRRPIVLVPIRPGALVASGVAPGLPDIGLLLPYTAMHHLLAAGVGRPLVVTSGNQSDEPIAHDDDDAVARLGPLADALVTHDRAIHIRCDDSVVRSRGDRLQVLRRSRGYCPEPMRLPLAGGRQVLALGAELKSTVAVAKDGLLVASHHLGDLEHLAAYRSFRQAIDHLLGLYEITPDVVAHDLHPGYLSTALALELDLPTVGVQHHHAHVAACMAEHGRAEPVLGIAFDGLGFGSDGGLWGGEFLVADLAGFERVGHLQPVALPGGAAAIRQPWRMAAVWMERALGRDRDEPLGLDDEPCAAVLDLAASDHAPITSSVGRLFDAAAALLVGRGTVTYEAQAAIELEAAARLVDRSDAPTFDDTVECRYPSHGGAAVLDPTMLVARILAERDRGTPIPVIAAGFHEALGRAAASLGCELARLHGQDTIVLTGGVFQNSRFSDIVETGVRKEGLEVLVHATVPPNDGAISIGQAAICSAVAAS